MKCPYCGEAESKVTDSRPTEDGCKIRRRRECVHCLGRFTTYEIIENTPLMVVKKDRSRQPFDREKLLLGLIRACKKRPITTEALEKVVDDIEVSFANTLKKEITSHDLGEKVLQSLKDIDGVAYIRFASVYREFSDVNSFLEELKIIDKM